MRVLSSVTAVHRSVVGRMCGCFPLVSVELASMLVCENRRAWLIPPRPLECKSLLFSSASLLGGSEMASEAV